MISTQPEPTAEHGNCTALVHRDGTIREDVPLSHLDRELSEDGTLVWLDVLEPTEGDFDLLASEFNLHPLAIDDLRKGFQRPKLDHYEGSLLIVLFDAETPPKGKPLILNELDIFVGSNYLITVHQHPVPAIESLRERWRRRPTLTGSNPLGFLLYHLADELVDHYFPVADALEERLEDVEDQLFRDFDRALMREVFALRRDLIRLRRVLGPERDVFNLLLRLDDPIVDDRTRPYFADVMDLVLRLTDTVDAMRELAGAALEAYLSMQSNQLNEVVKRMTAMTVTLMVPTLVAGVYGMNFEVMPELGWQLGYPFALMLMVIGATAALAFFRNKGWL